MDIGTIACLLDIGTISFGYRPRPTIRTDQNGQLILLHVFSFGYRYYFIQVSFLFLEFENKFSYHFVKLSFMVGLSSESVIFTFFFYTISFMCHCYFTCFHYFFMHFLLHVFVIVSFHKSLMFQLRFDISFIMFFCMFSLLVHSGFINVSCRISYKFHYCINIWIWTCSKHVQNWSCFKDLNVMNPNLQTDCKSDHWFKN